MATRTVAAGGGNFSAGATWVGGVAPVNGDDIIANSSSGNLTITTNTVSLAGANFTGYTGTLAFGANNMVLGSTQVTPLTLSAAMTITRTTGRFNIQQNYTIVSNGKSIPLQIAAALGTTLTLSGDLTIDVFFQNNNGVIFTGANVIITDPVPFTAQSVTMAPGFRLTYRPPLGTITMPIGGSVGNGYFAFDAGTISLSSFQQTIGPSTNSPAANAFTTVEFLGNPVYTGVGAPGGRPNIYYAATLPQHGGLTLSLIMATNSRFGNLKIIG